MIGFVHKHSFVSSVQKSFRFLFHLTGDCIFRRLYFFRFFPAFTQTFFPACTLPHEKETGKETIKRDYQNQKFIRKKKKPAKLTFHRFLNGAVDGT